MYKIGEFSTINKISQRMLRYYDEKNLLEPRKDKKNGYRYYTKDDIEIINRIKLLRKYNFSIDEIKNVLKMDSEDIKIVYQNKIDELSEQAIEYFYVIEELKAYIESNYTINIVNSYDVFFGIKKSFHALFLRSIVDEDGLELLIDNLNNSINKINPILNGKYFAIFHSVEERDFYLYDVEVCQPILVEKEVNDSRIKFFKKSHYISTIHIGTYDCISNAYAALYNWARSNAYILSGPYIETYYTDEYVSLDKNTFVTEVSIVVIKT